jgi:hypothetical protein
LIGLSVGSGVLYLILKFIKSKTSLLVEINR